MKRLLHFAIIIILIPFVFVYCGGDDDGNISIKGKVIDETGNPISGANIMVHPEDQSITNEPNGEFYFRNLADGNYQLTISASGYQTYLNIIAVLPGKVTLVEVVLKKGDIASIAGLVHDNQTGDAIPNATVLTIPATDRPVTTVSGRYEFVHLEPGTYTVRVFATGYSVPTMTVVVERDKTTRADFQLTKQESVGLSVTPSSLDFGVDSSIKPLTIENLGSDELIWNITFPPEGWLTVAPVDGSTTNIPSIVSVIIDRTGFPTGNYDLTIFILSNGGMGQIPVTMEVQ
ncbi:carboxypeptidase regulatory-like domain-containing protein [Candidatus Poribacteria bacterium]|nr:carboxypeptidase regulatory-like domain-containing protein [Candidatus Poribacteria bacterium]